MKTTLLSLVLTFLISFQAMAQAPVPVPGASDRFPESSYTVIDGALHRAFNLANFVQLLQMDSDLQLKLREVAVLYGQREAYKLQVDALTEAVELSEANLRLMTSDRDRLSEQYRLTNKRMHELENKPNLVGIFGWTLSAVALGVVAGLVTALAL